MVRARMPKSASNGEGQHGAMPIRRCLTPFRGLLDGFCPRRARGSGEPSANTIVPPSWPTGCKEDQGRQSMRLLFGIILGCLLTVGGAYVVDTMAPASPGIFAATAPAPLHTFLNTA